MEGEDISEESAGGGVFGGVGGSLGDPGSVMMSSERESSSERVQRQDKEAASQSLSRVSMVSEVSKGSPRPLK